LRQWAQPTLGLAHQTECNNETAKIEYSGAATMELANQSNPEARIRFLAALLVGLLVAAVYSRSLGSDFVFDARLQMLSDDYIHTPSNLWDVFTLRVMGHDALDFNRPQHLQWLLIESLFFGRNPLGYHLTSILLHAVNGALIAFVLCTMARDVATAEGKRLSATAIAICSGLGALLPMLHPMLVEAVAEPSFREDPLATFYAWLALLFATKLQPHGRYQLWFSLGMVWCTLDAIASKETGVATPVLLAGYFLLVRRGGLRAYWIKPVFWSVLVCAAFVAVRFALETKDSQIFRIPPPRMASNVKEYLFIQGAIWRFYFQQMILPNRLSVVYTPQFARGFTNLGNWTVILSVLLVQLGLAWRSRLAALGGLLFWAGLLPASNVFPQFIPAADRYLYLPFTGLAITFGGVLMMLWPKRMLRCVACALALFALLMLIPRTWQREHVFSCDMALWQDAIANDPEFYTSQNGLGWACLRAGDTTRAKTCFDTATLLIPGATDPYLGRAVLLNDAGNATAADEEFAEAVLRDPVVAKPEEALRCMIFDRDQYRLLSPLAARYQQRTTEKPAEPIDIPD
jgi:hypothetical protein